MIVGVADTHAALWYLFGDPRLSQPAKTFITNAAADGHKIAVSAVSLAEVVYLVEKQRLPKTAYDGLRDVLADPGYVFVEVVFTTAIVEAMWRVPRAEVPDMPDRMIAATALSLGVPLVSRDRKIATANFTTIW